MPGGLIATMRSLSWERVASSCDTINIAGRFTTPPRRRATRLPPRLPRPRTRPPCASFQINIGFSRCAGQACFALAKSCSRRKKRRVRRFRPPARRRRVDAPGNAGLYFPRMYRVYGALTALAWAAVLPYQMVMAILQGTPRPSLRERLGYPPEGAPRGGFWVHAVSVGEVRLALRILPELRRRFPGAEVHVTTGTATGRALAASAAGDARPASVGALPFDLPFSMRRLIERLRPRAVLIMETEIWPNLLRLCAGLGVPILLVNGRISTRSYPRYRALRPLLRRPMREFTSLGMQSSEDADRIVDLGAAADRVRVTGNLKFDLE